MNYIDCSIVLEGSNINLIEFMDAVKYEKSELSFQHLFSQFSMYDDWGTPLGTAYKIFDVYFLDMNTLIYKFSVTHRPPHEFFQEMSGIFKELYLTFKYKDTSNLYEGFDEFHNGNIYNHEITKFLFEYSEGNFMPVKRYCFNPFDNQNMTRINYKFDEIQDTLNLLSNH